MTAGVDYRDVDDATVYKGDVEAGRLRREGDDVIFEYLDDYLESDSPSVATTIPKRRHPVVIRGGAVPAFFAGLLPEGRRQTAIRSHLKTSADDDFTQLLAVGSDCIGDVRVVAPELPGGTPIDMPMDITSFRSLFSEVLTSSPLDDRAVPGVQDKLSDSIISVPVSGRYGAAIVKLSPSAFPRIVENEAFFLGVARQCGLAVPRYDIVHDAVGESALVVQRFDRIGRSRSDNRVAQEDSVQLLGRWPSAKYRLSAREVFAAVAAVAAAPVVETQKLIRLFALSYVIGNGDLHGKNVSVYCPDGLWQLTPAYDVLSTLPYGDRRMALALEGRDDRLRIADFLAMAARHGLNERSTRRVIGEVLDACEAAVPRMGEIGFDERRTADLMQTTTVRISELRETP